MFQAMYICNQCISLGTNAARPNTAHEDLYPIKRSVIKFVNDLRLAFYADKNYHQWYGVWSIIWRPYSPMFRESDKWGTIRLYLQMHCICGDTILKKNTHAHHSLSMLLHGGTNIYILCRPHSPNPMHSWFTGI